MRSERTSLFEGEVVYDMSPSFSAGRTDPGVLVVHIVQIRSKRTSLFIGEVVYDMSP